MHSRNRIDYHRVNRLGGRSNFRFGLSVAQMPTKRIRFAFLARQSIRFDIYLAKVIGMARPLLKCQDDFSWVLQHSSFELLLLPTHNGLIVNLDHFIPLLYFSTLVCRTLKFYTAYHMDAFVGRLNKHALSEKKRKEKETDRDY